jgi:hypothetical protein
MGKEKKEKATIYIKGEKEGKFAYVRTLVRRE